MQRARQPWVPLVHLWVQGLTSLSVASCTLSLILVRQRYLAREFASSVNILL